MKKLTWFFPLHPVPIYGQDHEKQKGMEIVTSLSLSCQEFSLKQLSISLSKQNMFRKIPFLVWPCESGNCGKERKRAAQYSISQERKELLRGNKIHFS